MKEDEDYEYKEQDERGENLINKCIMMCYENRRKCKERILEIKDKNSYAAGLTDGEHIAYSEIIDCLKQIYFDSIPIESEETKK